MENPYWHPEEKNHVVDFDEVRSLSFDVFNIVRTSMSMMGQGEPNDSDEDGEPTSVETVHYQLAEVELSKKLMRIAVLMRTLDDYWSDGGHEDYVKKLADLNNDSGVGWVVKSKNVEDLSLREAFNKIIHAADIRLVYETEDDKDKDTARWGMDGQLELNGQHRKEKWEVTVNLFPFLEAVIDLVDFVDDLQS